ncbi:MAG: tRNA (guanosine(46)-N7)-methyltransferase TrmB [Clostridia bacterium]|nr:tRNA (guanosine(46)-N7)-methyltransferase TrmB [Clostridia bacterium]
MRMRKKRYGNERLTTLSSLMYTNPEEIWSDLPESYEIARPLRIEIGCGKGGFITALSKAEPDHNYLAVERVSDVMVCAIEKYAEERGLGTLASHGGWQKPDGSVCPYGEKWEIPMAERGNVRFTIGDAAEVLSHLPDNSVSDIYANFSDPWPKKGYADRRLTSPVFLKSYLRVLKPGGILHFKTDNDILFAYSVETVGESEFDLQFVTYDLHKSDRAEKNIMTEYERNFSEKGVLIKALEAVKR